MALVAWEHKIPLLLGSYCFEVLVSNTIILICYLILCAPLYSTVRMVSLAETMFPAHATPTYPTESNGSDSESHKNGGSAEDIEKENIKCLSGYIFLCNQTTKLQCYQYRVFGLPWGKKEVVEEIKSGSKLFLFDFKSKLLYGVYEATSDGNLNLEPAAFGGKFPAQVKFKIFKECLPIPESSLRYVIKENYTGAKFKQELSGEQVAKLISYFRPLAASICQPTQQALAHVPSQPGAIPPSLSEYQQYSNIQPARPVLNVNFLEHESHRKAAYVDHQSLPAASSYVSHPQQLLYPERVSHQVQKPSYSRYTTVERRASHDEVASGGQYYQPPLQREAPYQTYQDHRASYYHTSTATDGYTPSVLQTQPYHQLALQGRQYQDSTVAHSSNSSAPVQHMASDYWQHRHEPYYPLQSEASLTAYNSNLTANAQYTSTVFQAQVPVPCDQSYLRGPGCQDGAVANSSHPAAPTPYTTSVLQTQVQAMYLPVQREATYQDNVVPYNSNPTIPAQYTSQREATYQDNVVPYNSNPTVPAQCTSQRETAYQDNMVPYNSNPTVPAQYASQRAATYQDNVVPYNSNPTVPAQYASQSAATYQDNVVPYNSNPTVAAQYTSQREAMYQDNVVPYNSNPAVAGQYTSSSQPQGFATSFPFQGEALH